MKLRSAPGLSMHPLAQRFALAGAVFLVIMGGCFFYLQPQLVQLQQSIAAAEDARIAIAVQMQQAIAQAERDTRDRNEFAVLEKDGFLGDQNRLAAAKLFETLRVQHRISALEYQIEPVEKTLLMRPQEAVGFTMSASEISLTMRGFIDRDLHDFVDALKHSLPGHVSVTALEMTKLQMPDNGLLTQISRGGGTELIRGEVKFYWRVANSNDAAAP